jgi:hypothetical protein
MQKAQVIQAKLNVHLMNQSGRRDCRVRKDCLLKQGDGSSNHLTIIPHQKKPWSLEEVWQARVLADSQ